MKHEDPCLEVLLDLNGMIYYYESGCWIKYEVRKVAPRPEIPHGIRYSLTLHSSDRLRIFGIDNAHSLVPLRKIFAARKVTWDHRHQREMVLPFDFESVDQLLDEFEQGIDAALKDLTGKNGDQL
jgi:hypothetical protein